VAQQAKHQGQKLFQADKKQEKIEEPKTDENIEEKTNENQVQQIPERAVEEQASSPKSSPHSSSPLADKRSKQVETIARAQIDLLDDEDDDEVDLVP